MKKRFYLTLMLAIAGIVSLMAQTTALVTYEGGYFVKKDKEWTEYRPADKTGKWATYEQYREDDVFFYVKNKHCSLAIPKLYKDKIHINRKKSKKWEVVYNTLSVHQNCPNPEGLFYSYRNHSMKHSEYDGYFVRNNMSWREFRPRMKSGVWAEFKQKDENNKYFILESEHNIVSIPKTTENDIIIKNKDNSNWTGGYAIQAVYDRSATYPYNFYYQYYGPKNVSDLNEKGARISLDNNSNIQIAFDDKHYDLIYTDIEIIDTLDGKEAILITIDKENKIKIFEGNAQIECKKIGKKTLFIGADSKSYRAILEQLKMGTFRM